MNPPFALKKGEEKESRFIDYALSQMQDGGIFFVIVPISVMVESSGKNWRKELLENNTLKNDDIRFYLGYSGWSKDQLQDELNTTSWVVIENNFQNIFDISHQSLWKDQLMKLGGEYQVWANAPENPSLN